MRCFLNFCDNFGLNCKSNFSFCICFGIAWETRSTITWIRFCCFLECQSVPKTKSVTTLMKHTITYWSQMKKTFGSLKMTTTVIVALIPNIILMIVSIVTNVSIPGVDQDAKRVEFVVQEERPKRKRTICPMMSVLRRN